MTDEPGHQAFDQLAGLLDYPMFVVTTRAGEELGGCLVGFTSQVSIRPPRFLVGLSKRNHTYRVARRATHLTVQLLPRRHHTLARLFGGETGDHTNKFDRCAWNAGPEGLPVLDGAIGWFTGLVLSGAWTHKEVFWWPAFGSSLPHVALLPPWPFVAVEEVLGIAAAWWTWSRFGLADPARRAVFWRTGRLEIAGEEGR